VGNRVETRAAVQIQCPRNCNESISTPGKQITTENPK
jgi:hypothetical protein